MILQTESEEVIRLLPERHVLSDRIFKKTQKNDNKKWHMKIIDHNHFVCHFIFWGHLLNIPKKHKK